MNRLNQLAVNQDGFAFDPMTGESFTLNPSAVEAVKQFSKGASCEEAAQHLTQVFDVGASDALRDVEDLVSRLKNFNLM